MRNLPQCLKRLPAPLLAVLNFFSVHVASAAAEEPIGSWRLNDPAAPLLRNSSRTGAALDGRVVGELRFQQPGPEVKWYPFLEKDTRAVNLANGSGRAAIEVVDPGEQSLLDIRLGETVSLEAWINVEAADETASPLMAKGAGRTLNYALGVRTHLEMLWPSFAFTASGASKGDTPVVARWQSKQAFPRFSGWHHLAATFTFGQKESVRLFLDGVSLPGNWEEGAEDVASLAPATNDLPFVIAASGTQSRFKGRIAEAKLWRRRLSETELRSRFTTPVPQSTDAAIGTDIVQVELLEGAPFNHGWIFDTTGSQPLKAYDATALGFYRIPQRYVANGVRGDWPNPLLLRSVVRVKLPAGRHRFLLRAHGTARLIMNGAPIAEVCYRQLDQSGHTAVEFIPAPPSPGTRTLAPACRETLVEVECKSGDHVFTLEARLGGRSTKPGGALRPELGETLAAIQLDGESGYTLLGPGERVPLTDAGWAAYVLGQESRLDQMDAAERAARRATQATYWRNRHDEARRTISELPPLEPPAPGTFISEGNLIDRYVNATIERALAASKATSSGTVQFHRDVRPILEANCVSCHGGSKAKGELRLDVRSAAFAGGGSGAPGIVPGRPQESEIMARIRSQDPDEVMPAKGDPLPKAQVETIERWTREGAVWPDEAPTQPVVAPLTNDFEFIRRLYLDVVGQTPSLDELQAFVADSGADKRARWIDRLLNDERWADPWVSFWQDMLAENPVLANLSANATGPFRWWLHESFLDNKPMDLFATELIAMRGSPSRGGPAGFAIAADNDAPMAEKAAIVSGAFLGAQMRCARCHDAPFHVSTQKDLFSLAAMLNEAPLRVPGTSSVPPSKLEKPNSLIKVTLPPGSEVKPAWPLEHLVGRDQGAVVAGETSTSRDRLAAYVTSPRNLRFAEVLANQVWARYFGRGLVEVLDDWEKSRCSHPELLQFLARELMTHDYDLKHVARLILNSHAYQRKTVGDVDSNRLFAAAARRQMSAEQIVDSLSAAFGMPLEIEALNLDLYNTREFSINQNLDWPVGALRPRRAWQMVSAPLDRDRPSLSLPRVQAVTDILSAFGWRGARFESVSCRETPMNPLQPASLANGTFAGWLVRLSDRNSMTALALECRTKEQLVDAVFLRLLNRPPAAGELRAFSALLSPGYERRLTGLPAVPPPSMAHTPVLSWSNNVVGEANELRMADARRARTGPPPTARLTPDWRERFEDALWVLVNSPETIFLP